MPVIDGKFVQPWRVPAEKRTRLTERQAAALAAPLEAPAPKARPQGKKRLPGRSVTSAALRGAVAPKAEAPVDVSGLGLDES